MNFKNISPFNSLAKMSVTIERNDEKTPLVTDSALNIPSNDLTLRALSIQETQEYNDERSKNTSGPFSQAPCSTFGHKSNLSKSTSLKKKRARQKLIIASLLCFVFFIAESVGKSYYL